MFSPFFRHSSLEAAAATFSAASTPSGDSSDLLTAESMAAWLKENKVLQITLQDSMHQPQYVEKLEKVIRFLIKERTLSLPDIDDIWGAQVGQHESIGNFHSYPVLKQNGGLLSLAKYIIFQSKMSTIYWPNWLGILPRISWIICSNVSTILGRLPRRNTGK